MTTIPFIVLDETISQILDEDRHKVYYRPAFAKLFGSVTTAILFERMRWWWRQMKQPFYKFNDICTHDAYKAGDSWQEELSFNRAEFEAARNKIATRITKGVSKTDALDYKTADGKLKGPEFLVIYWRDGNNLMWYQVNETLLKAYILKAYKPELADAEILHYLEMLKSSIRYEMSDSSITSSTVNTATNTTDKSNAMPLPQSPEPIEPSKPEEPIDPVDWLPATMPANVMRGLGFTPPNRDMVKRSDLLANPLIQAWMNALPSPDSKLINYANPTIQGYIERLETGKFTVEQITALVKRKFDEGKKEYPLAWMVNDIEKESKPTAKADGIQEQAPPTPEDIEYSNRMSDKAAEYLRSRAPKARAS